VYFVDPNEFKGLMLVGNIKILQDKSSRQRLWREGFEKYHGKYRMVDCTYNLKNGWILC